MISVYLIIILCDDILYFLTSGLFLYSAIVELVFFYFHFILHNPKALIEKTIIYQFLEQTLSRCRTLRIKTKKEYRSHLMKLEVGELIFHKFRVHLP